VFFNLFIGIEAHWITMSPLTQGGLPSACDYSALWPGYSYSSYT